MQKIQFQEKRFLRNKKKYAKIAHRAIRKKFPRHEQGTTLRFLFYFHKTILFNKLINVGI